MDLKPRVFRIPLRVPFRRVAERTGVLLEGPHGVGEFSPFPEYRAPETARWLAAAREAATSAWPSPVRRKIPVNVTIPAVSPEQAHALAASSGCSSAKVKVGDGDDEGRVAAVRDALGPSGRIRIDVNAAWDVAQAARNIDALRRYDLEYVEQPVPTLDEMIELRRRVDVPLAADETIRKADRLDASRVRQAADIAVLKVQPLGGIARCLQIAEALDLDVVVSSALETSVGISAGIALAAALPELPYACGLATASLLEGDVVDAPLLPQDGYIEVRRPSVDDAALARYEITGMPEAHRVLAQLQDAQEALSCVA